MSMISMKTVLMTDDRKRKKGSLPTSLIVESQTLDNLSHEAFIYGAACVGTAPFYMSTLEEIHECCWNSANFQWLRNCKKPYHSFAPPSRLDLSHVLITAAGGVGDSRARMLLLRGCTTSANYYEGVLPVRMVDEKDYT